MSDGLEHLANVGPDQMSLRLDPSQLSSSGVPAELYIVPVFKNRVSAGGPPNYDGSERSFKVDVVISGTARDNQNFNGAFDQNTSSSLVKLPDGIDHLKVDTDFGSFTVHLNAASHVSMISADVIARTPVEAHFKVQNMWALMLDHLSFLGNVPLFEGIARVKEKDTEIQTLCVVGPDREVILGPGLATLHKAMAPIYALYREYKNSNSVFYRTLCLYKIMEGIFATLKPAARKQATPLAMQYEQPKELVPDHKDVAQGLRVHVGKPIAKFYSGVLQKQYRDAVAHFLIGSSGVLHVSSAQQKRDFANVAFLAELCVRVLIANHEVYLSEIARAEASRP